MPIQYTTGCHGCGAGSTAPSLRGVATSAALVDDIKQKNSENPVIVYSKTWCPYCVQVRPQRCGLRRPARKSPGLALLSSGSTSLWRLVECPRAASCRPCGAKKSASFHVRSALSTGRR